MHDIDRTEAEVDMEDFEIEEVEGAQPGEGVGEIDVEAPFDEVEEMELAGDLLEVTSDQELDQFLGNLIKRAWRGAKRFAGSPLGRSLVGALKGVAKKALPIAGTAVGGYFGGPAGAAIGGKLAAAGGKMFGLELEGLSQEDQEFELARRFVRLAGATAKRALDIPANVPVPMAARKALMAAAIPFAPGLEGGAAPAPTAVCAPTSRSGRWIRRGRRIIVLGV